MDTEKKLKKCVIDIPYIFSEKTGSCMSICPYLMSGGMVFHTGSAMCSCCKYNHGNINNVVKCSYANEHHLLFKNIEEEE